MYKTQTTKKMYITCKIVLGLDPYSSYTNLLFGLYYKYFYLVIGELYLLSCTIYH